MTDTATPEESSQERRKLAAGLASVWQRLKEHSFSRLLVLETAGPGRGRRRAVARATRPRHTRGAYACPDRSAASDLSRGRDWPATSRKSSAPGAGIDQLTGQHLLELVASLQKELEYSPGSQTVESEPPDTRSTILIIDNDRELREILSIEAAGRGIRALLAKTPAEARRAIARHRPDLHSARPHLFPCSGGRDAAAGGANQLPEPIPVLVLTAETASWTGSRQPGMARLASCKRRSQRLGARGLHGSAQA